MSIANYSFLPFLRLGLAKQIQNAGGARGVFSVKLKVTSDVGTVQQELAERKVELYGPGDIVGIDTRAIFKTDPLNWITNFEPNYLPYIDFYDEDYPWRYSPLAPQGNRLIPWLTLVVLEESEFEDGKNVLNRPLPFFTFKGNPALVFPKEDQIWAWAHVHVNESISGGETVVTDPGKVNTALDKLQNILKNDPDRAYSRLLCPRKLKENVTYHAFVIPSFESGRLACSGDTSAAIAAAGTKISWTGGAQEFPYYHRWQFRTGTVGDFEYLVRLLKPKEADRRLGRRPMDMTQPGVNLKWEEAPDFNLQGVLLLGGALRVPQATLSAIELKEVNKIEGWATDRFPHPFQEQLATFLNLADDYKKTDSATVNNVAAEKLPINKTDDADPIITPPIYGQWHAMVERILRDKDGVRVDNNYNWLHELNLDPRYRVAAHFGTRVVQKNQEDYMKAAWEQVGEVLKANQQVRYTQLALQAGSVWYQKNFKATALANPAKAMLLMGPIQKRILLDSGTTAFYEIQQSILPNTAISAPMRAITRPRGRIVQRIQKRLEPGVVFRPESIIVKITTGEIAPAPIKVVAPGIPSSTDLSRDAEPKGLPPFLLRWLRKHTWLIYVPIALAVLVLALMFLFSIGGMLLVVGLATVTGLFYLYRLMSSWSQKVKIADSIKPQNQTPESVDKLPKSPDFRLSRPDENFRPTIGNTDSADALRFKKGLRDAYEMLEETRRVRPAEVKAKPIEVNDMATQMLEKINPNKTVPAWLRQNIYFPEWIKEQLPSDEEIITEAMAYPQFDIPMYEPLKNISAELFLPNIQYIENNSITLLETNQKFIEAYMVGLNHEFARELLWREYPTDQRGSYFRQFWDVRTMLLASDPKNEGKSEKEIREMYRDISKLHEWRKKSKLDEHDNRQRPGEKPEEEVVLVIRGDLLKKYPNAVVYAHKADWAKNKTGAPDKTQSRVLFQENEGEKEKPSFEIIRTPLYEAKVDPDITFFGFKLDVVAARGVGDPATPTKDNAGWFFIIKERPGEPRFGLDVQESDKVLTWNDLSWKTALPGDGVLDVNIAPTLTVKPPPPPPPLEGDYKKQREEDETVDWNTEGKQVDAADLAYILYQVPVLVAVHASEMLPKS